MASLLRGPLDVRRLRRTRRAARRAPTRRNHRRLLYALLPWVGWSVRSRRWVGALAEDVIAGAAVWLWERIVTGELPHERVGRGVETWGFAVGRRAAAAGMRGIPRSDGARVARDFALAERLQAARSQSCAPRAEIEAAFGELPDVVAADVLRRVSETRPLVGRDRKALALCARSFVRGPAPAVRTGETGPAVRYLRNMRGVPPKSAKLLAQIALVRSREALIDRSAEYAELVSGPAPTLWWDG